MLAISSRVYRIVKTGAAAAEYNLYCSKVEYNGE
jgi:hypothetical protein